MAKIERDSLCWRCQFKKWEIELDTSNEELQRAEWVWVDICKAGYVPGNHVINCPGFEKVKFK